MITKMSRTMFCQRCFDEQRPHDELLFAVLGSTNNKVWVHYYEAPTNRHLAKPYGYTPHFVVVDRVLDGVVYLLVSCGCNGCDTEILYSQETGWKVNINDAHEIEMPIKEYLALEKFTNNGYEL